MKATVYSQPECGQCEQTLAVLSNAPGVEVEVKNVREDPKAFEFVVLQGFKATPVVHTEDGDVWCGHNPVLLQDFINRSNNHE